MKHTCTLRVRTYECDSYGHVNNAVYLNYLEYGRMEFLRAIDFDYERMRELGFAIFIKSINIEYRIPAVQGETLIIESEPVKRKNASGVFRQTVRKEPGIAAEAEVTWVFVDSAGRPSRIPEELDSDLLKPEQER